MLKPTVWWNQASSYVVLVDARSSYEKRYMKHKQTLKKLLCTNHTRQVRKDVYVSPLYEFINVQSAQNVQILSKPRTLSKTDNVVASQSVYSIHAGPILLMSCSVRNSRAQALAKWRSLVNSAECSNSSGSSIRDMRKLALLCDLYKMFIRVWFVHDVYSIYKIYIYHNILIVNIYFLFCKIQAIF